MVIQPICALSRLFLPVFFKPGTAERLGLHAHRCSSQLAARAFVQNMLCTCMYRRHTVCTCTKLDDKSNSLFRSVYVRYRHNIHICIEYYICFHLGVNRISPQWIRARFFDSGPAVVALEVLNSVAHLFALRYAICMLDADPAPWV